MHPAFSQIKHRPWPLPSKPWVLQQQWLDLALIHWEISEYHLRKWLPEGLEIDTFDGTAWIGVVPFRMEGVVPRGVPRIKLFSDFPEINVRTYVIRDGKPGVWFFSLDIPNRLPVWVARTFFHLPYFRANMSVRKRNDGSVFYSSDYRGRRLQATYRGLENISPSPGSFEHWATERYCFYTTNRTGTLFRANIQHPQWRLQKAEMSIELNTMLTPFEVGSQHPQILYAKDLPVVAWGIKPC